MMTKTRQVLSYVIALLAVLLLSAFVLTSCGNPRKGLKIEYELVSTEKEITYDSDGRAFLSLTKEFDEHGELTSAGKAELAVKVVKGAKNLLRTIRVESSDPAKVGFDYWYDEQTKVNHVVIKANGATALSDSTYIKFVSVEDSKVVALLYVRVEEKATSMNYANNLDIVEDSNGNTVLKNLGAFDGVPFHLITNKLFRFGPSQATTPNLVYSVKDIYNFFDGGEFVYTSSETMSGTNILRNSVLVNGTYADGKAYKAVEFVVSNNDDKTDTTFIKKFRIPVYENLDSKVITVTKNDATQSSLNIETVFERVQSPANLIDYVGLYIFNSSTEEYVLVNNENVLSLHIVAGSTPAYQKANIDTQIVFINNKNSDSNNISLSLSPANESISYSYNLVEPASSYNYLLPGVGGLNRRSAYYGKYIKVGNTYTLITESNFASLGIIIGQTPCYSYSRTIAVVQNTDMMGNKINSFTLSGWRESLSGTYLTFYASYEGFLIDEEITTIPKAEKTIAIKVVNYPTQLFVNDKAASYTVLKDDMGEIVSSFSSVEEFLGEDQSGRYYFRTGETANTYVYTLINKGNYSPVNKKIVINGTEYPFDYQNFSGTPIYEEAAQEISVFDVYHTDTLNQSLLVELNGFSDGFDEFYVYVDAQELLLHGSKYPRANDLAEKLELVYGGKIEHLKLGDSDEFAKLVYKSGSRIYLSARTENTLTGIIPLVVEAKHNSGKVLQRKLVLRFVNGIKTIFAKTTKEIDGSSQEVDVDAYNGVELAIPASGDKTADSLKGVVNVSTLPENSATYTSLLDGVTKTYLSVRSGDTSIAKVGYFSDSDGFIENQINPETLSFTVVGKAFGETTITITALSGVTLSFPVFVKEVVSAITLNLDENTAPVNTFKTTEKISADESDKRTTLKSLLVEENVNGIVVDSTIYPANAKIAKAERFYLTETKYAAISASASELNSFKTTLYNYMVEEYPEPLGESDGIDETTDANRRIFASLDGTTQQKVVISTMEKGSYAGLNKTYVCIAYLYLDENNQKQIILNYFSIELYKAITGFINSSEEQGTNDVSVTLLSSSKQSLSNPYLEKRTRIELSVDIETTPGSVPNKTVQDVIWYFVDSTDRLVVEPLAITKVGNSLIYGDRHIKISTVGTSHIFSYTGGSNLIDIPQSLQTAIGDGSYEFMMGQKILVESIEMDEQSNTTFFPNLRACVVDVNGVVWTVKYNFEVTRITLVDDINVYDYDESEGIYFETAQKLTPLPILGDGVSVDDRLAVRNSYGFNDVDETCQSRDIDVSVAYQKNTPTIPDLEYVLLDAVVDDEGQWSVDSSSSRTRKFSSSNVWLGKDEATNKYFVTPISYGNTILYVLPQDHMIKLNEDIDANNIGAVLGAIKNSQVIKEFHITVADGYKTYIRLSSASDFEKLANNQTAWDKNYYVTNDIDLSGTNLNVIGTEEVPFSGKITTMPIVKSKINYSFIINSTTYYVVGDYVCEDKEGTQKVADFMDSTAGLIVKKLEIDEIYVFGGSYYRYTGDGFRSGELFGSTFADGETFVPIIRNNDQTSIIPTYTIYGINLKDTYIDEGGNVVSKIKNGSTFSYFGFFGIFAGVIEKVNFRFDSVSFETRIKEGEFHPTLYMGAFAGQVWRMGQYSKSYETIEGYYGKYSSNTGAGLINAGNAQEYFAGASAVYVKVSITESSFTVGMMEDKITKDASVGVANLFLGIIGSNASNDVCDLNIETNAKIFAAENLGNALTVNFGGFIGINAGNISNIEIGVDVEVQKDANATGTVGGLIGQNTALVDLIRAYGSIKASVASTGGNIIQAMGGVVGSSSQNLQHIMSSVVVGNAKNVGGVVGWLTSASLSDSVYSIYSGTMNAVYSYEKDAFVGGLVGYLENGNIDSSYVMSYATGSSEEIVSSAFAGGLVGYLGGVCNVRKSFFSASVKASVAGGIAAVYGSTSDNLNIENCFVKGMVTFFNQPSGYDTSVIAGGAGLLLGNKSIYASAQKTYVTAQGYVIDENDSSRVMVPTPFRLNVSVASGSGVYVLDTSFKSTDNADEFNNAPALTLAQMRDRTQIEETSFFKNKNMTELHFYNPNEINPGVWTVTEQNDSEPILKGLYPTIPTDITALSVDEKLDGVYYVSNNEIIISLSDYYKSYEDVLARNANNFFKLKISPNSSSGYELVNTVDESTTEGQIVVNDLRNIWINVLNSNTSVLSTSASNLYDLKFLFTGRTGTVNLTLSCAQNTNASITLTICVIEGFDTFDFYTSGPFHYNTTQTTEDTENKTNVVSIQKELSKRIEIAYTQKQRIVDESGVSIESRDVLVPSNLSSGFAIMFKEGKFGFGSDRFKEVISGTEVVTRQTILNSFKEKYDISTIKTYYPGFNVFLEQEGFYYKDGSNFVRVTGSNYSELSTSYRLTNIQYIELTREQASAGEYYYMQNGRYVLVTDENYSSSGMFSLSAEPVKVTQEEITSAEDDLIVFVDGYKYAKILKDSAKTTYVFAYYENSNNLTIFANDTTESDEQVWFTKYYVLENNSQKVAYYLNTEFCLFIKVYSGITELNVSGAKEIVDMERRAPSDEFLSDITFVSDSPYDLTYGVNATLYQLNTKTIHAGNTIVYDNALGQNPQAYSTIDSYYEKYLNLDDGSYVQITGRNAMLSEDGLMLILYLDGEKEIAYSRYDKDSSDPNKRVGNMNESETYFMGLNKVTDSHWTFSLSLWQSFYKNLDEVLAFRLEVSNVDEDSNMTKSVYFKFSPIAVTDADIHHYTDAELEEGDGTLASNYLTNAGIIPTDTILAGDYGLLEIKLIPEYGAFNSLNVSGTGTNLDKINFVQRVKNTYVALTNDGIVTQTRYYLYDKVSQDLNKNIKPDAVSNYYDGTVSLMVGVTHIYDGLSMLGLGSSFTYESFISDTTTKYYYYENGNYVLVDKSLVTRDDFEPSNFYVVDNAGSSLLLSLDHLNSYRTNNLYYLYDGNYILLKDLIDINKNTKKLKVTDAYFDFDGMIYLQTLVSKQTTTATSFSIDVDVLYDGMTQHFSKEIKVDASSTLAWVYDGAVYNKGDVNQEAYIAAGTSNQNLSFELSGEFDRISIEPVQSLLREDGTTLSKGVLSISQRLGTNICEVNAGAAQIGDVFAVSIIGYKNVGGYTRQVKRTIVLNVVDYILKRGAFKIEQSSNGILDKVYTNDSAYRINIIPNFDNIEISNSEPLIFNMKESYVGYYYKDASNKFHLIEKVGEEVVIKDLTDKSVVPGETYAYTEELKNLWEYTYRLNTDEFQIFGVQTRGDPVENHALEEQGNTIEDEEKDFAFTKVQYKASIDRDAAESGGKKEPVINRASLPTDSLGYYYIKYVWNDGDNNGFYVCPLSQGSGSTLYLNEIDYKYINGVLTIIGGLKIAQASGEEEYSPNSSKIYEYAPIGEISGASKFIQNVARYGTEIRFTQKTSIENPIPIYTTEEFFGMNAGNHYILMNDLTFTASENDKWEPINTQIASLDGNGKTITIQHSLFADAYGTSTSPSNIGFFGTVQEGTLLKNLTIKFSDMEKIDYREASAVNFGLFAGVNNGIITNCEVTVNNPDESQVAKATITILSMDRQTDVFNVGGFVGINNNAITNSRTDSIALSANGLVAGFACENNGTISSCSANFGMIKNTSTQTSSSRTAGFVLKNNSNSKILSSHVGMAYLEETVGASGSVVQEVCQTETITSNVNISGFVYENMGYVEDSFSAIKLINETRADGTTSFNASSSGFVFINRFGGKVSRCYSISNTQYESLANTPFVGSDESTGYRVLNYGSKDAFVDCLFYNASFGSTIVALTEELNIKSLTKEQFLNKNNYYSDCFENYSVARYQKDDGYEFSTVWAFASSIYSEMNTEKLLLQKLKLTGTDGRSRSLLGPQLVYANLKLYSDKKVLSYNEDDPSNPKYEYTENDLRLVDSSTKLNVRIISDAASLIANFDADLIDGTLDDWYRIVCDIDLTGVDISKYVNSIFEGNFDGNGFTISGVNITSSKADYCGFFGKIQTKLVYDDAISAYRNKDLTVASAHNVNFVVNAITATEVVSVGGVCGEAKDAVLSNIKVSGRDITDIQIIGKNLVGGVAGKISGRSRVHNILSEASVSAVYAENYTNKLIYNKDLLRVYQTEIDSSAFVLESAQYNADSVLCYAGAVFGVADLEPFNKDSVVVTKTAYSESRISNIQVQGTSKVVGGTVGGAIGLVGAGTYIHNIQKIVVNGTYAKGGRFAGGLIGENHGNINYARVVYEKSIQDAVDELIVGDVYESANIPLFRSQNAVVGGLIGLNIGLSLSRIDPVECGMVSNSFTKIRVDDETATYLGGLVGITIGGNFNSCFTTGSAVGARVGTTGGMIGFAADFNNTSIKQMIKNPFDSVEYDSFMLKGNKYFIETKDDGSGNVEIKLYDITSGKNEINANIQVVTNNFLSFTIFNENNEPETYYINDSRTIVYRELVGLDALGDEAREKMVALVNMRKYLSMDKQTLTLNNVVAKNNYAYTDFNRIKTIAGNGTSSNGVFGSLIGMASVDATIQTEHKKLTGDYNPEEDTEERNFYVSEIYATRQQYTNSNPSGEKFSLSMIGYDLRETREWHSFVKGTQVVLGENTYERENNTLTKGGIDISKGEFQIDGNNMIIVKEDATNSHVYTIVNGPSLENVSGKVGFTIDNQTYYIDVAFSLFSDDAQTEGKEILYANGQSQNPQAFVSKITNDVGGEYSIYMFTLNDVHYLFKNQVIVKLVNETGDSNLNNNNFRFSFHNEIFTFKPLEDNKAKILSSQDVEYVSTTQYVTTHAGNEYYIEGNKITQSGRFYIGEANNVYEVMKDFAPIAAGLKRYEMFDGSYEANPNYSDRMFRFWNVYDYGTKQVDDTYKIVNFDAYKMPIYRPTTDVGEIKIYTVEDFMNMKTTGTYRLMNDLDFEYRNVCLFTEEPFMGTFIGASNSTGTGEVVHTLYNVNPTSENENGEAVYAGIFSKTNNATITKLNISGVGTKDENGTIKLSDSIQDIGILVGAATDSQISDINITEDYNYIASYVNEKAQNSFVLQSDQNTKTMYVLTRDQTTGQYQYAEYGDKTSIQVVENNGKQTFTIGGTQYYLFVDYTKSTPYSYSTNENGVLSAEPMTNFEFTIDTRTYCLRKDKDKGFEIYEKNLQAPINISRTFELNGVNYTIEERVIYNLNGSVFKIGSGTYQLQDDNIYKKNVKTNLNELVSKLYDDVFMVDGVSYRLQNNRITVMAISQSLIENNLKLSGSTKLVNVGGLVGRYEVKELVENEIRNINVEADISVAGGESATSLSLGGVLGYVKGSKTYNLRVQGVVFDGDITTTQKNGDIGGILGYGEDLVVAGALVLGEMNINVPSGTSAIVTNVGGFAGRAISSTKDVTNATFFEAVTVYNDMNVNIQNFAFKVGGFAGTFESRVFNSVIAPNITIEPNENISSFDIANSSVAGFIPDITVNNLSYTNRVIKPIQNVLVESTIYNRTMFDKVYAVCDPNFSRDLVETYTVWSHNLRYDQNLSLVPNVQTSFAITSNNVIQYENFLAQTVYNVAGTNESGPQNEEYFVDLLHSDIIKAESLAFNNDELTSGHPIYVMNSANSYACLMDKLKNNVHVGSKLNPYRVMSSNSSEQGCIALRDVGERSGYNWFMQSESITTDILEPINLNGFYNGNNLRLNVREIDGAFGFKTDASNIGAFNVGTDPDVGANSVLSSLSVLAGETTINMNLNSSGSQICVGLVASEMGNNSVLFACYSAAKLQIQNTTQPVDVGGLVGSSAGQIIACGSNSDIYVGGESIKYVGGLVGSISNTNKKFSIRNSFYNGLMRVSSNGNSYAAGICGYAQGGSGSGTVNMKNCYVMAQFLGDATNDAIISFGTVAGSNVFYANNLNTAKDLGILKYNVIDALSSGLITDGDGASLSVIDSNNPTSLPGGNEWLRIDAYKDRYKSSNYCNSGLPVSAAMNGLAMLSSIKTEEIETIDPTRPETLNITKIRNEAELVYYLETYPQGKDDDEINKQRFILESDLDWSKVKALGLSTISTFRSGWEIDGNNHKITNLDSYFVSENSGVIKNIEFANNTGIVASTNKGLIQEVMLENGTMVASSFNGNGAKVQNCLAGNNAIIEQTSGSVSGGNDDIVYDNIQTSLYDLANVWTVIGTINNNNTSQTGKIRLQRFNGTTSNLDVFGVDGDDDGHDTYRIETKEQYSALVQYFNRHSSTTTERKILLLSDIDFGDINVTTLNGSITMSGIDGNNNDALITRCLTNMNVSNLSLFRLLTTSGLSSLGFNQVNYYAKADGETNKFALLTQDSSANIDGVSITGSLFNFVGSVNQGSLMVKRNNGTISNATFDDVVVKAKVTNSFGLVASENMAQLDGASVNNVALTADCGGVSTNVGLIAGQNNGSGTVANINISYTTIDLNNSSNANVGGLVGNNKGQISRFNLTEDSSSHKGLEITGPALNAGGLVGLNASGGKIQEVSRIDPASTNIIEKLKMEISSNSSNVGVVAGANANGASITAVNINGSVVNNVYNIAIQGCGNVGGIAGQNQGTIQNALITTNEHVDPDDDESAYIIVESMKISTIKLIAGANSVAAKNVGGLVGLNQTNIVTNDNSREIVVNGLNITGYATNVGGFIGTHTNANALNGIKIENSKIDVDATNIGGIVGALNYGTNLYASIDKLTLKGEATNVGGFVGTDEGNNQSTSIAIYNMGAIHNGSGTSTVGLTIDVEATNVGGILGYGKSNSQIYCGSDSAGDNSIIEIKNGQTGTNVNVGGAVGYAQNTNNIKVNKNFNVTLLQDSVQENFGGIAGKADNLGQVKISSEFRLNTTANSSGSSVKTQNLGGIVGLEKYVQSIEIYQPITINSKGAATNVGGLVGKSSFGNGEVSAGIARTITATATSTISIANADNAGGIMGSFNELDASKSQTINLQNTVNLTFSDSSYAGGFFGEYAGESKIQYSSIGTVNISNGNNAPQVVGGIVGISKKIVPFDDSSEAKNITFPNSSTTHKIDIKTSAQVVGGVVGVADGTNIDVILKTGNLGFNIESKLGVENNNSVTETQQIGGIVGLQGVISIDNGVVSAVAPSGNTQQQIDAQIEYSNAANFTINATNNTNSQTCVGGVVARNVCNMQNIKISGLTLEGNSQVGGIAGINDGTINRQTDGGLNYAQVQGNMKITANSKAGLFVAVNNGTILQGTQQGASNPIVDNEKGINSVTYRGNSSNIVEDLGIVVSVNAGVMQDVRVELTNNASESYTINSTATNVGFIVANNTGVINNGNVKIINEGVTQVSLEANNSTNVGIFGKNTGSITLAQKLDAGNYSIKGKENVGAVGYLLYDPNNNVSSLVTGALSGQFSIGTNQGIELKSVSGKYAGAIGYNDSVNLGNNIFAKIINNISGQYVGGIIGKNDTAFNSSEMLLSNVGSVFDSSATYVGGIIGENNAQITALKANISGTVSGDDRVGGFAGITTQPISGVMLSNDNNGITVQGNTNVGGWFGEIAKNGGNDYTFDISNSGNTIKVASVGTNADSSCVGGIAGINNVTIKNANISAVSGFGAINGVNAVGGVAGVNNGTIINVTNEITLAHNGSTYFASNVGGIVGINETTGQIIEDNGSTQNQAIIGGIENVGGIAGTNKGLINGAEAVSGAYVTGKTNVGGIAGYNSGTLKANTVSANVQYKGYNGLSGTYESGTTQEEVLARATWNFGGIAGYNSGTIGGLNDADRNTINGIDVAASTMVGGIVGYNTGTVNKTIVSGNINVVFVGIYSGPMAVSDYEDIYIIGRQYLGTNVGGDSPDERHVRCAIATAIPVFCADQGKIQAYLNAAQITGVTIADYFSSGEDLSYGVAGRAIGYDAGFVATSSGDDILSEDENDSAYRSLLVDTNNQVNRNNVVIKSKQTQIGNTPKLPANITSRFGKLKYITIDENDKAWIVWFEKVSSTSVDGHTEYHASTQLDVAVYETIN